MKFMYALLLAVGGIVAVPLAASAAAPVFQLEDLRKLVSLQDAQISPDGKRVVVIVSTPDWKTAKNRQEIDLVDVASGARRALTWKRSAISTPRWSPDGKQLAFIAKDAKADADAPKDADAGKDTDKDADKPEAQVFVMSMQGGDPMRVTQAKHGVSTFAWSPDSQHLAFVTQDEPANAKAIKAHDDAFEVTDNNFLVRAAVSPWHLWLVSSTGGEAKRLTKGAFSLQNDQDDPLPPAFSRDGKRIAFTRFPSPYWGPSFRSTIATVSVDGGDPQTLVTAQGANGFSYAGSGNTFAFVRPRNGDQNNGNAVYVSSGSEPRDATQALARNFDGYAWLPKGKALLLAGADGTHAALWEQPLSGAARKLDLGGVEANAQVSVADTGAIAFIGSTSTHPNELYVLDGIGRKPRRLTNVNVFVDGLTLGRTESITWKGPDGFDEDGVLVYPPAPAPGGKYPLVLMIHGGPEAASTERFSPLPQLMAAAGFLVFEPNYRGSTNLGDKYQHAIFRDTGEAPGKDVMAGLAALQARGSVDKSRIGVSGWSYGGYMTAWLTGHYDVWKAAVSGAALTDWVMDYTISYYQEGDTYFFGGSPWQTEYEKIWREQSPITYARNVTAPTLIMGDVGDPNVPLVNSYEWYHALRDNGTKVEFYAYPVDTHFPGDIVRSTDVYRRWIGWMQRYLK